MPYSTREAQREYARKWVAARRAEHFRDKACAACGSSIELELDHIDPSTKVTSVIWSWSQQRRDEELLKCQVLCKPCHKVKTAAWRRGRAEHGAGLYCSKKDPCRCVKCKKGNALYRAKWIAKNRQSSPTAEAQRSER